MGRVADPEPMRQPAPLPDPWRASWVTLAMALAAGAILAWIVGTTVGVAEGAAAGLTLATASIVAEMQAAWRLRRALARFAAAFPTQEREAFEAWTSEQGIRWPALALSVEGRVGSYLVEPLAVEAGGAVRIVAPRDAREAGEETARLLGVARPP